MFKGVNVLANALKATLGPKGRNPMDIKRGIDKAVLTTTDELNRLSKPCKDTKAIAQVGAISANSDESIGNTIADAMEKVSREGVITVEEGQGLDNELEVVDGHAVRSPLSIRALKALHRLEGAPRLRRMESMRTAACRAVPEWICKKDGRARVQTGLFEPSAR